MELLLAVGIGALFAVGFYMLLRRSVVRLLLSFVCLSLAANLTIFTSIGLQRGRAALARAGEAAPEGPVADPLAQALILTAIVISFGVLAFAMVLVKRLYMVHGTEDLDLMEPHGDSPEEGSGR
ncbi:MAG: NADH-quinone oxidoreductase subunit K [Fimbriimonadaceae bacterium]|nr:NADH-quinone oxidoreductase subunit K [Fimbriimonadaceae bacterium]